MKSKTNVFSLAKISFFFLLIYMIYPYVESDQLISQIWMNNKSVTFPSTVNPAKT